MAPDPFLTSVPQSSRELRVLVVHNQDFHVSDIVASQSTVARADVVHAAHDVARALASHGHFVEVRGINISDLPSFLERLQGDPPDLIFNLCESFEEDDRHEIVLPSIFDALGIPYTGSGPFALQMTLRKEWTNRMLQIAGIRTPRFVVIEENQISSALDMVSISALTYPLIVKPTRENASVGISSRSVVHDDNELKLQLTALHALLTQPFIIEEFIEGREVNISVIGSPPTTLAPYEIDFSALPQELPRIVTYDAKWSKDSVECLGTNPIPAQLSSELSHQILDMATRAFECFEMSGYGRFDIRISTNGTPYLIDINPNCDLSSAAGFAKAALQSGLSYDQAIAVIANCALHRSQRIASLPKNGNPYATLHSVPPRTRSEISADSSQQGWTVF